MAVNIVARNPRAGASVPIADPYADFVPRKTPTGTRPPMQGVNPAEFQRSIGFVPRDYTKQPYSFEDLQQISKIGDAFANPRLIRDMRTGDNQSYNYDLTPPERSYQEQVADRLFQPQPGGTGTGGTGGAGGGAASTRSDTMARARAALEAELAGVGGLYSDRLSGIESMYGSQFNQLGETFGGYRSALSAAAGASRGQINQATEQALARLAQLDPQAAFQWAVGEVGAPGVAGGDYLSRIGASSAEVDATRMLSEQLMRQQMAAAQQYSMGSQSSMDRERQARQAASGLMSQEALTGLSLVEQQRQAQIADEEMRRRQALENAMRQEQAAVQAEQQQREQALRDQLLRYQLEYDLGA
jgi:hypothetical protein